MDGGATGGQMALKDLERFTCELEELISLLHSEARPQARWIIIQRAQELMQLIGKGTR